MSVFDTDTELAEYRHRLAQRMDRRRRYLGLTWKEVADRGGPSVVTLRQLRQAVAVDQHPRTLRKLDDALGWVQGSASAILQGGQECEAAQVPRPKRRKAQGPGMQLMASISHALYVAGRTPAEAAKLCSDLGLPHKDELEIHEWMLVAQMLGVTLGTVLTDFNVVTAEDLALNFASAPPPPVPGLRDERVRHPA